MKKLLIFLPLLLLVSAYFFSHPSSPTEITNPGNYTQTGPYSKDVIVSSPAQDAVVPATFAIKGKVHSSQPIQLVRVVVTDMYDKTQQPVKVYTAVYNPDTSQWAVLVNRGDLPDATYTLFVQVQDANGQQQSTYSSVVIDSSIPSSNDTPSGTI